MSEETGLGAYAARARETVLAQSVPLPAEADRGVVPRLESAYEAALWQDIADTRWPTAGNWRYLADYAIGATLAYPERAEYNQGNDTFALYRRISLPDGRYAFTTRVVVSGSDGKIITAFPQTGE